MNIETNHQGFGLGTAFTSGRHTTEIGRSINLPFVTG